MMRWEYLVLRLERDTYRSAIEAKLNELGQQGWEFVWKDEPYDFTFKRPLLPTNHLSAVRDYIEVTVAPCLDVDTFEKRVKETIEKALP